MKLLKILSLVAACSAAPAYAQSQFDELDVEDLSPTKVEILDSATGGCWTNAGEAKSYAEDQLRLAGVEIAQGGERTNSLFVIQVQGERVPAGFCVGAINLGFLVPVEFLDKEVLATLLDRIGYFLNRGNANYLTLDMIRNFLTDAPFESR